MACLIAAPSSGSGKTLLTLLLLALARHRGETIQPFKVGPDYLDPQLLSRVAGRPCRNLDPLLCGFDWVQRCFSWHGSSAQLALVEGVMGLFDGRGPTAAGSSAEVAALLDLPVVLVVEASRQAGSLAALVRGFRDHGPPQVQLAGVVLNRVSSGRHRALLAEALAAIGVPLLGVLPPADVLELPSRHLGLVPAAELPDLAQRAERWAELAARHLNLEALWPLLQAPQRPAGPDPLAALVESQNHGAPRHDPVPAPLPVAIASDAAFHFRYPEAGELLRALGAEPLPWSPLADEPLPAGTRAVVLPGGYPELHAEGLAAAARALASLRQAVAARLPVVAECGGLLLLGDQLADATGQLHTMAGVLPFAAARGALSLGYREAYCQRQGLLTRAGECWHGHEFHRWQLQPAAASAAHRPVAVQAGLWQLEGWGTPPQEEGWIAPNVHASWLHLHWAGCPAIPRRLVAAAAIAAPLPPAGAFCSPQIPAR